MASRHHDHVEFLAIPRSYSAGADIQLNLQISPQFSVSPADRVGIFRVGWTTAKDALYFEVVQQPNGYGCGDMSRNSVTFPASILPEDDGEFYQFCYMNGNLHACGVSKPFQFRKPNADDFLETEEADMLIVTSKAVAQEEMLTRMTAELHELKELNSRLEENRQDLVKMLTQSNEEQQKSSEMIESLKADATALLEKNGKLEMRATDLQKSSDQQLVLISMLEQENKDLAKKLAGLQEDISSLRSENSGLRQDLDYARGKVVMLSSEKELYQSQLRTMESMQKTHSDELSALNREVETLRADRTSQQVRAKQLEEELLSEKRKCEHFYRISNADKTALDRLRERCEHAEDKLNAAEASKLMYSGEITSLNETLASLKQKLEDSANESYTQKLALQRANERVSEIVNERDLRFSRDALTLKHAEEAKKQLAMEQDKLEACLEDERRNFNDERSRYLQMLQEHQEEIARLHTSNQRLSEKLENGSRTQDQEALNSRLQAEVADLKIRLQHGEREWINLHREKEALKKKLCRSRSTSSTPSDSLVADGSGFAGCKSSVGHSDDRGVELGQNGPASSPHEVLMPTSSASHCDARSPQVYIRYPGGRQSPLGSTNDDWDLVDHTAPSNRGGATAGIGNPSGGIATNSPAPGNDAEPERYYDANGGTTIDRCCICQTVFGDDLSNSERQAHMDDHFLDLEAGHDKRCPMCNHQFPVDCNQIDFETHVHQHFSSM